MEYLHTGKQGREYREYRANDRSHGKGGGISQADKRVAGDRRGEVLHVQRGLSAAAGGVRLWCYGLENLFALFSVLFTKEKEMKSKGIKNLLIDLGGVLINLDRQRCIENFQKLGLRNVEELLDISNQDGILMQQEKGLITPAEFRNGVREMIGKVVSDKQIDAAWNSFLVDIPTHKLDLLLKLREKYVVYLLSNTNEIHWKWTCKNLFPYRTFKVEDYFEKTYLSFEMKMAKPEPEIFKAILDDAGIEPEETLFIDDSEINCKAAQNLGISTYTAKAGEDWSHLFNSK